MFWAKGPRGKFLERAEGNTISLAERPIDGAGLGHTHLGVVEDEGGDVAGMGIAVPDEAAALGGLIDRGLEDPEVLQGAAQRQDRLGMDAGAMLGIGHAK